MSRISGTLAAAIVILAGASDAGTPVRAPAPAVPPASAGHALVFDDSLRAVLLVNAGLGGMNSPPASTRTKIWRWIGSQWAIVDSVGPPIRNLGGVAYDSKRDVLVIYGGSYDQNLIYEDTWEWSRRGGWERKKASGPGRRDHTEMAYDAERACVVLFGGQVGADSFPADTWTWDGAEWRKWAQPSGPPSRVHHTMVYDPALRRVLLFGGYSPPSTGLGDTWAWTGREWSKAASPVYPRNHARLVVTSRGVIVIGGFPARTSSSVLLLHGGAWKPDHEPGNPGARYLTAAAYDPLRKVTVLFGGSGPPMDQLFADTWEYNASTGWRETR